MHVQSLPSGILALAIFAPLAQAVNFDCGHVQVNGHKWDFSKLNGDQTVHYVRKEPPSIMDTKFTINICKNLARDKKMPSAEQCSTGTRICAQEYANNTEEETHMLTRVIDIAGNYEASHGRGLDPDFTRLKDSASNSDSKREGLRVEFHGGKFPDTRKGIYQKAIIEFECDAQRTGLEGPEGTKEDRERRATKEEDEDEDDEPGDDKASLKFISYQPEFDGDNKQMDVLRLQWRTKYACETVEADDPKEPKESTSSHWGFFTWFIIIVFLGIASYLIFGSWLNYNRYGARGWDLLPHGDTIRDIPYLAVDWVKSCINRVQGGGARGGYSAV